MPINATQNLRVSLVLGDVLASLLFWMSGSLAQDSPATKPPTFYRDVLPILEQHCQSCHRAGGIAPMPFETYEEARPFAGVIRHATQEKSMPPWFAASNLGQFSNDPSLSPAEIATLAPLAETKSPAWRSKAAAPPRPWPGSLRSIKHRADLFETCAGAARADAAAHERPFRDTAGRAGLPGRGARHAP